VPPPRPSPELGGGVELDRKVSDEVPYRAGRRGRIQPTDDGVFSSSKSKKIKSSGHLTGIPTNLKEQNVEKEKKSIKKRIC
jgi:hypothetical protein